MLHTETIAPATLELLRRIMSDQNLPAFRLVGGTSLALQIGHRISVDLDLFSNEPFDENTVREYLEQDYGLFTDFIARQTVKGEVNGVKIDCISHEYPWIRPYMEIDGIRIVSLEDLCAMKLNAIVGNGTRIKDFIDIAYLSSKFSLSEMLAFYEEKYGSNTILPLKSITYFEDIDFNEPVMMTSGKLVNWKSISKRLHDMVRDNNKIFPQLS